MNNFPQILKEIRKASKISQEKLANLLFVDRSLVSQWERGICEPNISSIQNLCRIFQVTADELLGIENIDDDIAY